MVCFKIVSIDSINYPRWLPWLMIWEKFEDTKGVIRSHKSKDRQHNGQKKKNQRTNNDLQNITQKTKDQATWTSLKTGSELGCSGKVGSSWSTSDTCPVTVKWQEHKLKWKSCWTPHITEMKHGSTTKQMGVETNRTSFLREHHNTELKTWRHLIWQHWISKIT
jgi:hypothetical protein